MLKKLILSALVMASVGVVGVSAMYSPTAVQGNNVPYYFSSNTNFPVMYSRMGMAQYMDRTSAVMVSHKGHEITIAVNTFTVDKADTANPRVWGGVTTQTFTYDTTFNRMYADGRYIPPDGIEAETRGAIEPGEAAYYILTGRKFYGSERFDSSFYNRF